MLSQLAIKHVRQRLVSCRAQYRRGIEIEVRRRWWAFEHGVTLLLGFRCTFRIKRCSAVVCGALLQAIDSCAVAGRGCGGEVDVGEDETFLLGRREDLV
jgi:hypothetical protein